MLERRLSQFVRVPPYEIFGISDELYFFAEIRQFYGVWGNGIDDYDNILDPFNGLLVVGIGND